MGGHTKGHFGFHVDTRMRLKTLLNQEKCIIQDCTFAHFEHQSSHISQCASDKWVDGWVGGVIENIRYTFICDQSLGSAAAEAVQQRLGSDVAVEKRGGAADLQQSQPQKEEDGLISQQQRHHVALFDAAALQEDPGRLAAELICIPVGVGLIFETDERLVRLHVHHLQEAVQDEVITLIMLRNLAPHFQLVADVSDILKKVRVEE